MNIQEIWQSIWNNPNLPKPVKFLLLFIIILVVGIGGFFGVEHLLDLNGETTNGSPENGIPANSQKDYSVSVETTDSEIVKGLAVQYELDNKGGYESLVTETGGSKKILISPDTKAINFRLKDNKDYEDYNKTVDLNKSPNSYKIILVRRMTPIASSPQQTGTIKLKVRLIWFGTTQGIEGAELRLFDGTSPLGNKKTTDIGYTEFNVPRKGGLTIQVKHPELKQDGQMISVQDLSDVEGDSADLYKELSKK